MRAYPDLITPNREEIAEQIRASRPGLHIWNPSPDWLEVEVFGVVYWIPPYILGEPQTEHPKKCLPDGSPIYVKADGYLEVKDRFGYVRGRRQLVDQGFDVILKMIETLGIRGITYVDGDLPKDTERKKRATMAYRAWQNTSNTIILDAWSEKVKNFAASPSNKGKTLPMSEKVRRAIEFRDSLLADNKLEFKYVCQYEHYSTNEKDIFFKHMRAAHSEEPDDVVTGEMPTPTQNIEAALAPVKKARRKFRRPYNRTGKYAKKNAAGSGVPEIPSVPQVAEQVSA
jgi:hypothetical protein